jgi:hypothetical protein
VRGGHGDPHRLALLVDAEQDAPLGVRAARELALAAPMAGDQLPGADGAAQALLALAAVHPVATVLAQLPAHPDHWRDGQPHQHAGAEHCGDIFGAADGEQRDG